MPDVFLLCVCGQINIAARTSRMKKHQIKGISILSGLGVLSNLIGSLSLANEYYYKLDQWLISHYFLPTKWIMHDPNKNKMRADVFLYQKSCEHN